MIRLLLLTLVLAAAAARPVQEENDDHGTDSTERLQREFDLAAFVENFKMTMSVYVSALHTHLNGDELAKVMALLNGFLERFVEDLKEVLYNEDYRRLHDVEEVDDGMSKDLFDDISTKVRAEFKEADDEMTDEIVFRIRKNLLGTRQRLEQVVDEAMKAYVENSTLPYSDDASYQ